MRGFQLHHTGIKTHAVDSGRTPRAGFQLHHTGIKTAGEVVFRIRRGDFNCTIQELKLSENEFNTIIFYFNCTIQELKQKSLKIAR